MRIGLISDSHGKVRVLETALKVMLAGDVQTVVHCGDICCVAGLRLLGSLSVPAWLVAGNMDRHMHALGTAALSSGITFSYSSVEVPIGDNAYLVATHGHDEPLLEALISGQQFPYVCHGHTHRARDAKCGETRVICPGSLYAPRYPRFPTAAILDTGNDDIAFYNISHPDTPVQIKA